MAIDANAMYRAGFGSKSTGRNVQVDERNARWDAITKTAFNVIGQAAIGQIKQNYRGLQQYRNASDSQTALLNLKVDKMPASSAEYGIEESQSLKGSVLELKSLYDAAARKASFGIGKGRSQGRQDMTRYMKQLSDMNAILEIHKTKREKAQSMMSVAAGGERQEGAKDMSAGSDSVKVGNSTDLALGSIGARLRWNIETGEMEVQVGGDWQTDEQTGLRTYKDKAETGTYEEYVAQDQEMYSKLDQKYEKYYNEESGTGVSDQNIQSREDWNKSQGFEEGFDTRLSREDWTKQNQENRGAVSTILYKNMKFAVEADGKMAGTIRSIGSDILKMSYKKGAIPWERVSEKYYGELQAKIGEYTDDEFKDYFFGGDTFDHSTGRMTESAPAYQLLLEGDKANGYADDNGNYKNPELYGPGTADWEGRLLALKGQSFVKGSSYRKEATDRIFKNFENKYTENVKAYKNDNPEVFTNPEDKKTTWDTSYGSISKVRANLFVNKVKNGEKTIKDIRGHNGVTYTWDLQGDGRYMTQVGEDKIYRTKEEMLIQNEMESYYSDVFKGFSQSAAKASMPDVNNDGKSDFIVPIKYNTYTPEPKRTYRRYNSNDAKKGIGIPGKYYEAEDGTKYQFTREDGEQKGEYIKIK